MVELDIESVCVFVSWGGSNGTYVMFVRYAHRNISKGNCCLYVGLLSPLYT